MHLLFTCGQIDPYDMLCHVDVMNMSTLNAGEKTDYSLHILFISINQNRYFCNWMGYA